MEKMKFVPMEREARYSRALFQDAVSDQLFREVAADREELATLLRRSLYYQVLCQAAVVINSTLHLPEVLRATCESVTSALGAKGCSVLLLSRDRRELIHSATHGLSEGYMRKGPVSVDASIAETLLGHTVAIDDACHDSRVQYGPQNQNEGIASILSVPMRPRGEVIGVMRIYTAKPRHFTSEDAEFVKAIANLAAVAIENATVHDSLEHEYETMRQQKIPWAENFRKPTWR